jgi:hypothetical protein
MSMGCSDLPHPLSQSISIALSWVRLSLLSFAASSKIFTVSILADAFRHASLNQFAGLPAPSCAPGPVGFVISPGLKTIIKNSFLTF